MILWSNTGFDNEYRNFKMSNILDSIVELATTSRNFRFGKMSFERKPKNGNLTFSSFRKINAIKAFFLRSNKISKGN